MTLFLDPRAGSKELLPYFKPYDVEVMSVELEFGDICFFGNGQDGKSTSVGVEHKTLADVVNSMRSGRLSGHQIPGLLKNYDHVILLVEGIFRCGEDGSLQTLAGREWTAIRQGSRPVLYRELSNYLVSLEFVCGVIVQRCGGPAESVAYLVGLYKWFEKAWQDHDVQHVIYTGNGPDRPHRRAGFNRVTPGPVEMVASVLPGVDKKAWAFGKTFKTVEEMVGADEERLQDVEGIGKVGAKKIWQWLR